MLISRLTIMAMLALVGVTAHGAEVAVFPVNAVNLASGESEAIGTVLAQSYARAAKVEVLSPQRSAAALKEGVAPSEAAKILGVREYIEVTAVGLMSSERASKDQRIVIKASRYQASGAVVYQSEMTAMSMGDVEVVAQRLARSLYDKVEPTATLDIHSVSKKEATAENRTFVQKVKGFKTSMAFPVANGDSYNPLVSLGFDSRFETARYFLEFGAGLMIPSDSSKRKTNYGGLYGELGGSYYLSEESFSPYIGAGVLPRLIIANNSSGANMAFYGQFGLMFARESTTRLYTDVRVAQNIVPVQKSPNRYPTELGLEIGIGW